MTAREEILTRIGAALAGGGGAVEVPRRYRTAGDAEPTGDPAVVARFCERTAAYGATVRRCATDEVAEQLTAICSDLGLTRLAVAPGMTVRPSGVALRADEPPLPTAELDALDGALTGCAAAIADTGTLVLDGSEVSGRRALTLVPDVHVCIVEQSAIHATVPDALAALAPAAAAGRPLTFVSGPSATSDIELDRVEGVHGPRTLVVLVVGRDVRRS